MIHIKTKEDMLEYKATAGCLSKQALRVAGAMIKPGVSTREIDAAVEGFIRLHGATPGFKGYGVTGRADLDGFRIVEYDIYQMIIDILEERGYIDKCIRFEKEKGRDYLYKAVSKLLRLTTDNNLIVNRIVENTPENSVVFLTGIGKAYPFVRAHNVLNNLHQVFDKTPVVMFYPGNWNGQSLSLFGTISDGNYYRAFPLIQ